MFNVDVINELRVDVILAVSDHIPVDSLYNSVELKEMPEMNPPVRLQHILGHLLPVHSHLKVTMMYDIVEHSSYNQSLTNLETKVFSQIKSNHGNNLTFRWTKCSESYC